MGHYSSDYEHDAKKQKERRRKDLNLVEESMIKARQNLPLDAPGRIKDAFGSIQDWLTAQKHG